MKNKQKKYWGDAEDRTAKDNDTKEAIVLKTTADMYLFEVGFRVDEKFNGHTVFTTFDREEAIDIECVWGVKSGKAIGLLRFIEKTPLIQLSGFLMSFVAVTHV